MQLDLTHQVLLGNLSYNVKQLYLFFLHPFLLRIFIAKLISDKLDIPVERKIFFFKDAAFSNNGRFVISPEGIFMQSILHFLTKNSKLSKSNAVDKNLIFSFTVINEVFVVLFF